MSPFFSILIVSKQGREGLLRENITSLFSSLKEVKNPCEVILLLNGNDLTEQSDFLKSWKDSFAEMKITFITVKSEKHLFPSEARNRLISKARGSYILIADDDIIFPQDYFKRSLEEIMEHDWDVLGGPDHTRKEAGFFERHFSLCLESPLTFGHTIARHRPSPNGYDKTLEGDEGNLILCHLWLKRSLFNEDGFQFDSRLFRNEENLLLWQLKDEGKKLGHNPSLYVFHQRKKDLATVIQTYFKSGHYRILSFIYSLKSYNWRYTLPLIALFSFFKYPIETIWFLGFYCVLLFLESCFQSFQNYQKTNPFFLTFLKLTILTSYLIGNIWALFKLPKELFHPTKKQTISVGSSNERET